MQDRFLQDPQAEDRAERLRRMMNEYLLNMSPAERDRRMQVHLAQARGQEWNTRLLRAAMNWRGNVLIERNQDSKCERQSI